MTDTLKNWQRIAEVSDLEKTMRPSGGGNVFVNQKTAEKIADHLRDYREQLSDKNPDVASRLTIKLHR